METGAVDLARRHGADAHPRSGAEHGAKELLTLVVAALLRVVQARERAYPMVAQRRVVEQDARDDEGAGERAAPRLVRPRDPARAQAAVEAEEALTGPGRRRHGREDTPGSGRSPAPGKNGTKS